MTTAFANTYIFNQTFSLICFNFRKNKFCSKLTDEYLQRQLRISTTNLKAKHRQTFRRHYSARITLKLCSFLVLEVGDLNGGNCAPFIIYALKIWLHIKCLIFCRIPCLMYFNDIAVFFTELLIISSFWAMCALKMTIMWFNCLKNNKNNKKYLLVLCFLFQVHFTYQFWIFFHEDKYVIFFFNISTLEAYWEISSVLWRSTAIIYFQVNASYTL
jgi:hypothetical protein